MDSGFRMDMHIDSDSLSFLNSFSACWLVDSIQLRLPILGVGQASTVVTPLCVTCQDARAQQSHAASAATGVLAKITIFKEIH